MARQHYLEIANFILRFGERLKMIDLFEEVVLPAFLSDAERSYRDTNYFLLDVQLIRFNYKGNNYHAVAGRFVKDTKLKRFQLFDREQRGLVKSESAMATAPSSIFVLVLEGHRLLYVREHGDSPVLETFKSTISKFLTASYYDYIDKLYKQGRENPPVDGSKVTKKGLGEEIPRPTLELIEVAAEQELRDFVERYQKLKDVRVSLVQTNDEIDNEDFFRQMRVQKDKIKSQKTTLIHHQKEGLDKAEAIDQLQAALNGTAIIRLEGESKEGDRLVGNNEQFKVRVPLGEVDDDVRTTAERMFIVYMAMIESRRITVPETPVSSRILIEKVSRLFEGGRDDVRPG